MTTTVCLTFDFDAQSLWIGTFKQTTPTPISRGDYGARVGVGRILDLLARHGIAATFFVPGHTARAFPGALKKIADAGHEIAAHNDVHESPLGLSREQEAAIIDRAADSLSAITGERPVGYRSPSWDLGPNTIELLVERGYRYDSSMMADDFRPYRPARSERVHDDGTVERGPEAPLWEFPVAWELDDFPYFTFVGKPVFPGLRSPAEVGEIWFAEFDYGHRHVADGVFTLTMHPQIIGRGPRMEMLDRLIARMRAAGDVAFSRMRDAARALDSR